MSPPAIDPAVESVFRARDLIARDFHRFVEQVLRDERGRPMRQGALHRAMRLHVEHCWRKGVFPAVLGPVEHGKTGNLVVGLIAHELGLDPSLRVKVICANDRQAMKRVMGVTSILRSPVYRMLFPRTRFASQAERRRGKKTKETQHEIYLAREGHAIDPSVEATGVLMAGTGGRADLLVFDDVVEQRNALDLPELREKVIKNVDNVWMHRLRAGGRVLLTGQPWHREDLIHDLERRPAWSVLRASISDDLRRIDLEVTNPPDDYPIPERPAEREELEALGRGARLRAS